MIGDPVIEEPAEDFGPVDTDAATRNAFIHEQLGTHSSHPQMAPKRLAFWRWISMGMGSLAVAFAGYGVYSAFSMQKSPLGGVLSGLRQAIKSTDTILFVVAVGLSATLTAALTIRIARIGRETQHRAFSRLVFGSTVLMLVAALWGLCMLFGWLATTNSIQSIARNRWWIAVAAALPLEAILLYVEISERRKEGSAVGWLFAALRQLWLAACVSATVIVMTPSAARMIGSTAFGWLKSPTGLGGLLLGFIPGGASVIAMGGAVVERKLGGLIASTISLGFAMVTIAWVVTKVSGVASAEPVTAKPVAVGRSWLSRMFGVLASWLNPMRWFSRATADDGEEDAASLQGANVPAWAKSLRGALKDVARGNVEIGFFAREVPEAIQDSRDFAPVSAEEHLEIFFNGRPPTVDQVAALRMFDERWFQHSRALQAAAFGPSPESHADMMVQAYPESFADLEDDGVLELQVAASVIAVVARGQRVLFLVPSDDERTRVVSAVQARYESLRIETLYRVGSLDASELSRWAPPAVAPSTIMEERPPDVMVGTLSDYEQAFFGGANAQHVVRAILFDAEVVMVPNLLSLSISNEGRLHFPFILDKHRLILASENRSMQLVLGTPPIGERPTEGRGSSDGSTSGGVEPEVNIALEAIALRLFGGDSKLAGHSAVLRRRSKAFPARVAVRVPAADVAASINRTAVHIARSVGASEVCVVLGREDSRPDEDRRAALAVGKVRIHVVHELDCADGLALGEQVAGFQFVVVQGRVGSRLVRELGVRVEHSSTVIVEVTSGSPARANPIPSWSLKLPVFPSAESPALALAHLRSGAYQLGADMLVRREEFVRFGIAWNRTRWAAAEGFQTLHDGWSIELDGNVHASLAATEDQGEVWPAAILRRDVRKERPVLLRAPAERGLGLSGDLILSLAEDGFGKDPDRAAVWVTQRGQILEHVDLAYESTFRRQGQRQEYRALSAERSQEHGWIITAQPYHGEADEPVIPAMEVSVEIPGNCTGSSLQLRQGDSVRIFTVRDGGGKDRCLSRQRISGLVGRGGRASSGGSSIDASTVSPIGPLEFSLRVGVSFLCIGKPSWIGTLEPPNPDARDAKELPEWIRGRWSVGLTAEPGRTFSPAFTAAVQHSLQSVAPGILQFARVAAFRVSDSDDGVVIAFIEPHTTVGTAAEAMRTLLDDRALRHRFIGRMLEAMIGGNVEDLPEAPLYLVGMTPEERDRDSQWAQQLMSMIPGSIIDVTSPLGAIVRDSEATLAARPEYCPAPLVQEGALHRWIWRSDKGAIKLGVELGIDHAAADAATLSYGCTPDEVNEARLRRCGVRLYEGNRIGPDYVWMIKRSEQVLEPLAQRLLIAAQEAGAASVRDRVEFFASFVQSLKYERGAEGRISDGKVRMGVQMPAETLFTKCGDCDSLSVLLVGLVRAAKLATGCIILIEEVGGGHAMAAFEIDPRAKVDWVVRLRASGAAGGARVFTVVETTHSGWRMGDITPEYCGRYVSLDAIG